MTIARTYRCPGTDRHPPHAFRYLHHPSVEADPLPRYCPHCGADGAPDEAITTPHIARPIKATVDNMYREMEAGAEHRANMAMEQFGLDATEVANMKLTNMRDHMQEGDISELPVNNAVTQVMEAAPPGTFGFQDRGQGLGYSQAAHDTPILAERNPGARAQAMLRQHHQRYTADAGHAGPTTSSMPALETTAPSYRRRV